MEIVCLDLEGVLVPEIWIAFAEETGIPELKKTTRDEPDYDKLMKYRLNILKEHNLGLKEIQETIAKIDPLPGAKEFLDKLRELTQVIINVEAQKDEPGGYEILNRAIFYVSRLISSQKERDFENSSYDDMKRVYSIWVCMNMEENTMSHIHLTKDDLIGRHDWKGKLDLLNIVMIGLAKELPEHSEMYELHRLLGALLSNRLSLGEKLDIIGGEYEIPMEEELRKDVSAMCNLSQGIEEEGIAIGHAAGLEEGRTAGLAEGREAGLAEGHEAGFIEGEAGLILKMYKNGFTAEQIAAATDKDIKEVERLIADKDIIAVE